PHLRRDPLEENPPPHQIEWLVVSCWFLVLVAGGNRHSPFSVFPLRPPPHPSPAPLSGFGGSRRASARPASSSHQSEPLPEAYSQQHQRQPRPPRPSRQRQPQSPPAPRLHPRKLRRRRGPRLRL